MGRVLLCAFCNLIDVCGRGVFTFLLMSCVPVPIFSFFFILTRMVISLNCRYCIFVQSKLTYCVCLTLSCTLSVVNANEYDKVLVLIDIEFTTSSNIVYISHYI